MLIVLLTVWLGIVGPMPDGIAAWLHKWQTLAAAGVASVAAYVAFLNTSRSLDHAEKLEERRRVRKHAAVRAVLPLALSQVVTYAEQSAHALSELVDSCVGAALPGMAAPPSLVEPLPSETLKVLAEFIEFADDLNVGLLEATVAQIQIHDSRLRGLVGSNRDPAGTHVVTRLEIEARILDAASIYAGAAAYFDYARRRSEAVPSTLAWDNVASALRNMSFWDEEHMELYAVLEQRQTNSVGPFERLNVGPGNFGND